MGLIVLLSVGGWCFGSSYIVELVLGFFVLYLEEAICGSIPFNMLGTVGNT